MFIEVCLSISGSLKPPNCIDSVNYKIQQTDWRVKEHEIAFCFFLALSHLLVTFIDLIHWQDWLGLKPKNNQF